MGFSESNDVLAQLARLDIRLDLGPQRFSAVNCTIQGLADLFCGREKWGLPRVNTAAGTDIPVLDCGLTLEMVVCVWVPPASR